MPSCRLCMADSPADIKLGAASIPRRNTGDSESIAGPSAIHFTTSLAPLWMGGILAHKESCSSGELLWPMTN